MQINSISADFRSTLDYPNRHATYRNAGRAVYDVFSSRYLPLTRVSFC